jgi:DNA-binding transcriptional ArsR family regulator
MAINSEFYRTLQKLETYRALSKIHRLCYMDLFTYINHFDYFIIRLEELQQLLKMKQSNVSRTLTALRKSGLIKKKLLRMLELNVNMAIVWLLS